MFMYRKKIEMPTSESALPGRAETMGSLTNPEMQPPDFPPAHQQVPAVASPDAV